MARVLFGVCGGIAAYKAVEVVRLATAAGHSVRVVQTESATRFVGPATFEAITGAPVLVSEWEDDPARGTYPGERASGHAPISHLELVRRADTLAIVPASANTLAKLAAGLADNLLTSAALASIAPLVLAPAMNDRMWAHPATRANLATLRDRGAHVLEPGLGALASRGEWGVGRLPDPPVVLEAVEAALGAAARPDGGEAAALQGLRVLVTAGGTREPIDAVRFVGNRSSGRMGFALAEEAARRGAEVVVVAANVALDRVPGIRHVEVSTAAELAEATRAELARADVLLMAAAVADFRPSAAEAGKIEKAGRDGLVLALEPTEDVLSAVSSQRREGQTMVGFAAEHGPGALARAREKLDRKRLDAVVLNDVSGEGIGFDALDNEVTIVTAAGKRGIPRASKPEVAGAILDAVGELRTHTSGTRPQPPPANGLPAHGRRPDDSASSAATPQRTTAGPEVP